MRIPERATLEQAVGLRQQVVGSEPGDEAAASGRTHLLREAVPSATA